MKLDMVWRRSLARKEMPMVGVFLPSVDGRSNGKGNGKLELKTSFGSVKIR
jgi:hypothetical protein